MSKTETSAAGVKAAYVCPHIACYETEFESSLCAGSGSGSGPSDGGHVPADYGGELEEEDEP